MKDFSFPMRHVSIRVPWHDSGWGGTVCLKPKHNTSCLKLVNIADSKSEEAEEAIAGQSLKDMNFAKFPPCVKERGTFMAPFSLDRFHEHPYAKTSVGTHGHFRSTRLHYPAYAAAALPFRWMMKPVVFGDEKQGEPGLVNGFPLEVNRDDEQKLKFETHWIQDHRNHRTLLDCFWNHVRVEESLVFFYAKQVPLVEDTAGRRVIVGVGRVLKIGPLTEYDYDGATKGKIRSLIWERMVTHSIRADFKDGFLMPYQEALRKSDDGRLFDPAEVVAFAPEDRFTEFSYATEHVGHDAAIGALLACREALLRANQLFNVSISNQEQWIDRELGRLWKKRGPFPGMGAVLGAVGVPMGNFVAQALVDKVGEEGNPWQAWDASLREPLKYLPAELARRLDATIIKAWQRMPASRRKFLELLSRIDVSSAQAEILAVPEAREEQGISIEDSGYLKNPYLFYESTRLTNVPVSVNAVDRGVFPAAFVREKFPLDAETVVNSPVDGRRLRALVIKSLEEVASDGDTLGSQSAIITTLRSRHPDKTEEHVPVTADLLAVAEEENFPGEVRTVHMADGSKAYQLERLSAVGELIRSTIDKRAKAEPHKIKADWRAALDEQLPELPPPGEERDKEERARQEKAAALAELAARRLTVLIGPAGTGKTTLLSVLCRQSAIHDDGVLMLAPTGKARVRMQDVARRAGIQNLQAYTLAQFLTRSEPPRYDASTGRYLLTGQPGDRVARTVIVDECSMLTEEMTAALLEAMSGVHRLIFVGDPRQLPPIGAGRPFADMVVRLQPDGVQERFPRVGPGYAELTVPRRQGAGEREDLQLAAWFGGGNLAPGEDQVFEILAGKRTSETVRFQRWDTPEELEALLPKVLSESLGFDSKIEEWQALACSLGGQQLGDYVYFNRNRSGAQAEAWQILSPVRQKPWGVEPLNRALHVRYKAQQLEVARANVPPWKRRLPAPLGDAQIVYGDKVINLRNQSIGKRRIFPEPADRGYLANGEIGMVIGQLRTKKFNYEPKTLQVEFSTQPGLSFEFYRPKGDDDDFSLELAYALTVHKAQGSEFGVVILVLPRSTQMLSRELLYTALTRQKQKVIVLHQGSAIDLHKLSSERFSATATRLTNLFGPPRPVKVGDIFLEERLIHRTVRGDAVRSKSEVIIANMLHAAKVDYHYEQPLELGGVVKYPDFTIEDDDAGATYYWEHCGMLHDAAYRRRWEEKQTWYRENDILPHEEGGGSKGTLIVTRDQIDGGIDSAQISGLIDKIFRA